MGPEVIVPPAPPLGGPDLDEWRLFIDSSKRSLRCVLLHKGNKFACVPIGHSVVVKEHYLNMKMVLNKLGYSRVSQKNKSFESLCYVSDFGITSLKKLSPPKFQPNQMTFRGSTTLLFNSAYRYPKI